MKLNTKKLLAIIAIIVLALGVELLIGQEGYKKPKKQAEGLVKKTTVIGGWGSDVQVLTVFHDGHSYVVAKGELNGISVSIIHHPGCQCLRGIE